MWPDPDGAVLSALETRRLVSQAPRCCHCKLVIGRDEPIVVFKHGQARVTSRARELDEEHLVECYHQACYERAYSQTRHQEVCAERGRETRVRSHQPVPSPDQASQNPAAAQSVVWSDVVAREVA
jgi:hypothetical protein